MATVQTESAVCFIPESAPPPRADNPATAVSTAADMTGAAVVMPAAPVDPLDIPDFLERDRETNRASFMEGAAKHGGHHA